MAIDRLVEARQTFGVGCASILCSDVYDSTRYYQGIDAVSGVFEGFIEGVSRVVFAQDVGSTEGVSPRIMWGLSSLKTGVPNLPIADGGRYSCQARAKAPSSLGHGS